MWGSSASSSRSELIEMRQQKPRSAGAGEVSDEFEPLLLPDVPSEYRRGFTSAHLNVEEGAGGLPFSHVYGSGDQVERGIYIPRETVIAAITAVERDYTGSLFSPYIYTIELSHGNFSWKIKRRYTHFLKLHRNLQAFRVSLNFPLLTRADDEGRRFRNAAKRVQDMPNFPLRPDKLLGDSTDVRARQLEKYLNALLRDSLFAHNSSTLSFLEVSYLSFVSALGPKLKEGMIRQRSANLRMALGCCHAFWYPVRSLCSSWRRRWLMLRDTFLVVIRPNDGSVRSVMLMDSKFDMQVGLYRTGRHSGILLSNQTRTLTISSSSRGNTNDWLEQIRQVMRTTAQDFIVRNRFTSFAPIRTNDQAQWFVDGEGYMKSVARALEGAKEEIFIADWMLSAELFLIRPIEEGDTWRLDKILQRKAEEGVKIFVLLYKEVELALAIGSAHSRRKLQELHPENIKVLRHPDHVQAGVLFWAHHEKIVVIDQTYAFLGGLDLCFGRWDNYQHRLVDLDNESLEQGIRSGAAAEEPTKTVTNVANALEDAAPPPNVAKVEKKARAKARESSRSWLKSDGEAGEPAENEPTPIVKPVVVSPPSPTTYNKKRLWLGKDYMNFIMKDFADLHLPFVDIIDRTQVVRMPWHDIGVVVQGKSARDVARHFIQRWNAAKFEIAQKKNEIPVLMPKSYENLDDIPAIVSRMKTVNCQILRSASAWSVGIKEAEKSIQEAYIHVIYNAKHFVYIENQFFISLIGKNQFVHNKIADAIYNRIVLAHKNKEIFRVYVVMPLLPGFEGELGKPTGVALQAVAHWNYSSMSQGPNSLYVRLAKKVGDPTEYLTFYGLRTHDLLIGQPVSELVYVHSKMLIADDLVAIIGSANINDRSMCGYRDSEIAVIVEDVDTFKSRMAEQPFRAGTFVGSLRRHIFREHLGLIDEGGHDVDLSDPVSDRFFKGVWWKTAAQNTKIFEEVFYCVPSDYCQTFEQMRQFMNKEQLDVEEANKRLKGVSGQLVLMPLQFLAQEYLSPSVGSVEVLLPTMLWT